MSDAEYATVRLARREDVPVLLQMIRELASFEGFPDGPEITAEELLRDGFDCLPGQEWFFSLVAERAGEVVGHALCTRAYSSWTHRSYYVEDLYVRPDARRHRVAQTLISHLCQMAMEEGVKRVDWHVLENNVDAMALYARLGARDLRLSEGRAALRLDVDRIAAVAAGHLLASAPAPAPYLEPTKHTEHDNK